MAYRYRVSAFADEISPELTEQIDILRSESIPYIEFRGVWHKNVLDLDAQEITRVKEMLDGNKFGLSAIGSPIGKVKITDPFEPHVERFAHAIELAKIFGTPNIRVFSFFIPEGEAEKYRDEVLHRMSTMARMAEQAGVIMMHENERHIYGDIPERCLDIIESVGSPNIQMAFDPANFVQCDVKPFDRAYPLLKNYITHFHVKDAVFSDHSVRPAGEGDGQVYEVLAALFTRGYDGFLVLEPHLKEAGTFSGFTGADLFHVAAEALRKLLVRLEQEIGKPETANPFLQK